MALLRLRLRNFKAFDDRGVELFPGRITVLIGPNGSGKSSILQALGLVKQSRGNDQLKFDGPQVFGDLGDLMHQPPNEDDEKGIVVELDSTFDKPFRPRFHLAGRFNLKVEFQRDFVQRVKAEISTNEWELIGESDRGTGITSISPRTLDYEQTILNLVIGLNLGRPFGVSGRSGPSNTAFERAANKFFESLNEDLENLFLVPALRGFEVLAHQQLPNPIKRKDLMEWPSFADRAKAIATVFLHNDEIEREVSKWMEQVTGRSIHHRGAAQYHVALMTSDGTFQYNLAHDGFGTNQLLYLFTQIALAPSKSFICIDEPEIHLHPRAQNSLSSVLVDIATQSDKQLLLSTHSEHVLMGLVTAVAQGRLRPEELSVYYFSRSESTATAERLEVTAKGQIKGGLKGFFEVEIEEQQQYLEALSQKSK